MLICGVWMLIRGGLKVNMWGLDVNKWGLDVDVESSTFAVSEIDSNEFPLRPLQVRP